MFEASRPFPCFDYFRVPYRVWPPWQGDAAQAGWLRTAGQADRARPWLGWLGTDLPLAGAPGQPARHDLHDFTFFARVAPDAAVPALLAGRGRGWHRAEPVLGADGQPAGAVWRDLDGSVFLPFDPGEVIHRFWSEQYRAAGRSGLVTACRVASMRGYYAVRPALPRPVQLRLRQAFTRLQSRSSFPAWPAEDSLHNFYDWLLGLAAGLAGHPVPCLDPWPGGRSWALVLTHDVETGDGYHAMDLLRGPERERGYRSSWNFVGQRYPVDGATVRALADEGCEVGVHGLRHDGRDLAARQVGKRLPEMRRLAAEWGAVGFRSPATHRDWALMPRLGFGYDSSYSDTAPYEPQPGGCCSYLPYFNEQMVELPITLPQDHTLFTILQHPDASLWLEKAAHIRERRGMALVLTHPDYAHDPRLAGGYRRLLDRFAGDGTVWHALPREVAAWWRQRAASVIRPDHDGWRVEGPAAAEARVRLVPVPGRPVLAGANGARG